MKIIPYNKFVVCCVFYNDVEGIKRLYESAPFLDYIFVDGRFVNYDGSELSNDGSREYLKQYPNVILIDAPDMVEYQKRNEYIKRAQELGFDYCFVIDSDEFITEYDYESILKSLSLEHDAYSHRQDYDSSFHYPYYRIHRSTARHQKKHQEIWIDDRQIFTPNNEIIDGYATRHDKSLRSGERERYNRKYYAENPIR